MGARHETALMSTGGTSVACGDLTAIHRDKADAWGHEWRREDALIASTPVPGSRRRAAVRRVSTRLRLERIARDRSPFDDRCHAATRIPTHFGPFAGRTCPHRITFDAQYQRKPIMNVRTFKPIAAALIVAASLGATAAHADGLYGGAALGAGRYQDDVNGVSGAGNGVSGKVFGGYQFNPYLGLEAGYADLGHVDNSTGRVDGRSEYLDAVGTLPL